MWPYSEIGSLQTQLVKIRSYWKRRSFIQNDGVPYKKRERDTEAQTQKRNAMRQWRQRLKSCRHKPRNAKDCRQITETGMGQEGFYPPVQRGRFGFPASRTVVWKHSVGGTRLLQSRNTNTAEFKMCCPLRSQLHLQCIWIGFLRTDPAQCPQWLLSLLVWKVLCPLQEQELTSILQVLLLGLCRLKARGCLSCPPLLTCHVFASLSLALHSKQLLPLYLLLHLFFRCI